MPRPVHFEIHAQDPERGKAFYEQLFGWRFQHLPELDYWLIHTGEEDGGINGGLLRRKGPNPGEADPVIGWICTMGVDDVDATMVRAKEIGGTIAMEKMDVPGYGWLGYCKDTEGNIFGVMQAKM